MINFYQNLQHFMKKNNKFQKMKKKSKINKRIKIIIKKKI